MVEQAELLPKIPKKEEKTPEEKRREFKVIKGGGRKGWGPAVKAGAIIGSSAAVVSGVAAALGETNNLPDPLQGFYDQVLHPSKVAEEVSDQAVRDKYDVEEASEDLTKIVNENNKTQTETTPETTTEIEKVDAPEIKGETFSFILNQETRKYIDQETKEEVGTWIENAVKIEGKMTSAIALKPEALNKILEENRQKGIFKCPWPFDWQKNKDMEIVELISTQPQAEQGMYVANSIAIKYSDSFNFYAPFDTDKSMSEIWERIPDKEGSPNYFTSQNYKGIILSTNFSYKTEEMDYETVGSLQFVSVDLKPLVDLGEIEKAGEQGLFQDILGEVKSGDPLGEILPEAVDFEFLDSLNNPEFFENPEKFQAGLFVYDFQDDFTKPTSSLEKMLKYTDKEGQGIPVCVWPEENTAHEQNN